MELNKINNSDDDVAELVSPDAGLVWEHPMCMTCKYSDGKRCNFYKTLKLEAGVDLFDCPSYEESDKSKEKKAMKMMGL